MNEDMLFRLLSYDDSSWYLLQLMREQLYEHIPVEDRKSVIARCEARGKEMARRFARENSDMPIADWFVSRGIKIKLLSEAQAPPLILFASVSTKPACVKVYTDAIKRACQSINLDAAWPDGHAPDSAMLQKIILSHECFHLLDDQEDEARRFIYRVHYKIGPLKRSATIRQTAEITAAAFTKELCALSFNPGILDVALLTAYDKKGKDSAQQFITSLESAQEQLTSLSD